MKLIIGLGNPGQGYANNRHNVGFVCLNHFARTQGIRFDKKQGKARIGIGEVADGKVIVARPQTYMNLSGQSVSLLAKKSNINLDDLLVIHDDLDLPVGRIKVVKNGGAGGHKGVLSITDHLHSRDFSRVKIGIGRPHHKETVENYVLSPFYRQEKSIIKEVSQMAVEACKLFVSEGIQPAMNQINCQDLASFCVMDG